MSSSRSSVIRLAALAACLLAVPAAASAQQAAAPALATAPAPASDAGPRLAPAGVGLAPAAAADLGIDAERERVRARATFGQSERLMIVGGAALIAGLIIGGPAGTVIAVGGAGIGLYGLWMYVQ